MSSNISSMLQFWKNFNLIQLQRDLDVNATELANRQDASDASRRRLVEQSKEFKRETPEDIRKLVSPLLRSFQGEIDALSKRSKACEADFLNLYKRLIELPDPVLALEQAESYQRKAQRLNDVETENQKLRETLAEYNKEFAEVKNQEVTIKTLRERVRDFEKGTETRAKQLTLEKNEELQKQFEEKEKKLQETQLLIATKLGEAEQMASTFKAALDASQAELFDLKSKYDEETAAKQAELDLVLGDLDRSSQRNAIAEKEIENLREQLLDGGNRSHEHEKPSTTAMEEAFEVLSRSSLESELANKEKEISQLVEDVQHLQGSMGKLRDTSASAIAKLEEELSNKNSIVQELQRQLEEREDYNEIKRELQIIKSTEFSTLDSTPSGDQFHSSSSKSKSLEMLLLEKNRAQQSENTALRAANAQLTGSHRGSNAVPITPPHSSPERVRRGRERSTSSRYRNFSTNSHPSQTINSFSPSQEYSQLFEPTDALSQLQLQNQQLNALLNLKILANIKAAVAAQNINTSPLSALGGCLNMANQSRSSFRTPGRETFSPHNRPGTSRSNNTIPKNFESHLLAKYLSQLQKLGVSSSTSLPGLSPKLSSNSRTNYHNSQEFSDSSDNENYDEAFSQNSTHHRAWGGSNNINSRHVSDPSTLRTSAVTSHNDSDTSFLSQIRRHSLGGDQIAHLEEVDTEELTCQVRELLQANNIGQRAFGQYVLGLSQGSVSEILSKPKPWSKLTYKGKEPFFKMLDFVSSSSNVDALKSLQRKDREDRVLCGGRTQSSLRQADPDSEQAIANILAAAREEMRVEQEKIKRSQDFYTYQRESETTNIRNSLSNPDRDTSPDKSFSKVSSSTGTMTTVAAAGRCSYSDNAVSRFTEKVKTVATSVAVEQTLETGMPSLIKRQRCTTGNESGRVLQKTHKDKHIRSESQSEQNESFVTTASGNSHSSHNRSKVTSSSSYIDKESVDHSGNKEDHLVKSEPRDSGEVSDYFGQDKVSKSGFTATKEELLSANQRLISSQPDSDSLQRLFVTTTYNDPFIPPPLSPTAEESRNSRGSGAGTPTSDNEDRQHCYSSPFMGAESHYMNDNGKRSPTTKSDTELEKIQPLRKRVNSLSPPSRHSSNLLHDPPVLFRELSCPAFDESDRDATTVSSTTPTTFSNMLSSNMSSLQTSSSLFDSHASYTELSPVTTGTLYNPHRDDHTQHGFSQVSQSSFTTVEGAPNGISSMLPPLTLKSHPHHGSSPIPTYSALTNTISSSKYANYPQEQHHTQAEADYNDDQQFIETSDLMPPIPPEALHRLSMSQVDTVSVTKQVRDRLAKHAICQRIFGEKILGLSQGTVSDILSHPKPWGKLTHKGREPFARMIMWLTDATAGGLLPTHAGSQLTSDPSAAENTARSPTDSSNGDPINLTRDQAKLSREPSPSSNGTLDSNAQYVTMSPPSATPPDSAHTSLDRTSPHDLHPHTTPVSSSSSPPEEAFNQLERHFRTSAPVAMEQSNNGSPITPLQQMLNIQELAASCPKLDTFALTRKVKDLLTEHNIGQRIFGQAVLGLTQGSVSDLLSRPKLWRSLSLKGREPFVRMQLWLSDPNNIEQLKNLKLERWMEKKWGGKRQRSNDNQMQHNLSPVKKQRIVLSTEEKEVLRRTYGIEPYPSQETVDLLAGKLGRKSSTIVNWFHNYRSRVKRGFFPGDEIQDGSGKKSGLGKMTVKQLLDSITLSKQPCTNVNQGRGNSFESQRNFASKNSHRVTTHHGSTRRQNSNMSDHQMQQQTWVPTSHIPSPTGFDRYVTMDQMKTETMDQHFQGLHRVTPSDIYSNQSMHIKEETKMMELQSENDAMFSSAYSYPTSNTVSDIFKSAEMALSDPVSLAAASSFIQPKPMHHHQHHQHTHFPGDGNMYTNLDEPHQDNYAVSITNDSYSNKVPVSPPSDHGNSILPPVHTLTPKKSFGSPTLSSSSLVLPSASSLLNQPQLPSLTPDLRMDPHMSYGNSRPHLPRLVDLSRPQYDAIIANNNMNNNSRSNLAKHVSLPGGVSLSVTSTNGSPTQGVSCNDTITATVWVSSPSESSGSKEENTIISKPNVVTSESNQPRFTMADTMANDKENTDDSYAWVF
uniref:uncharacterized protein LOC120334181 n=1 Tax=Styela clava TaxID=7725 RepID=UPI00193A514A|nr:uncharacterized protein LOC120334181 [Styela clava]